MKKKSLLFPFFLAIAIIGFSFGWSLHFGAAQAGTNVVGIITSSTTWSKANSPYTLTGPVAVNTGTTLTIEAGASVNLNNFYIQVNGTLIANGSDTDKISFSNGQITFTSVSNGWNETTGSGCIIENTILDRVEVFSSKPLKISNSTSNKPISVGDSSIIFYNKIVVEPTVPSVINAITAGVASVISFNNISSIGQARDIYVGAASIVTSNILNGSIVCKSSGAIISNNNVTYNIDSGSGSLISNNTVGAWITFESSTVLHNIVVDGLIYSRGTSTISYNTVTGLISSLYGDPTITYNTIHNGQWGRGIQIIQTGYGNLIVVSHNIIDGEIIIQHDYGNLIVVSHNIIDGGISVSKYSWLQNYNVNATISDNNASYVSLARPMNATIERNIFASGDDGIYLGAMVNATAANNTIVSNNIGIKIDARATSTIVNNTLAFNSVGIRLDSSAHTITYNNFQNNSGYNIYLSSGATGNVDATNNWWGTTDTQTINQSIWDFKNDFNVSTVNFIPFLTAPNSAAPTIPTFNILASAGAGGSINPSGSISVSYGGNQTFAITANTDYQIADVLVDGNSIGAKSSYNFTNVQAEHTISATFAPTPTPTPSPSPTPTPSPSPTPTPTPEPTASPSPTPSPSPSPSPTATPTPTPTPTLTPTSTPTATPTPSPSPTFAPTPSPTATPSPQPTATASPTPPPDTGIYLSSPLFYAIVIAIIALTATIAALIIKIKR